MDKSNNHLTKSRSTNANKTKRRSNDKKSKSNAEILKPMALKKRGMYVAKKPTKISLSGPPETIADRLKYFPRPCTNQFHTSASSILSHNSDETLCPDTNNAKYCSKNNQKYMKKGQQEISEVTANSYKYRSRILNKISNEQDDIVVLQAKRNINSSPSNYTLTSYDKFGAIESSGYLPQTESTHDEAKDDNMFRIIEQPESGMMHSEAKEEDKKVEDKKIFNFFVDLLETTFDVYNVRTAFEEAPLISANSSKNSLEIDETIAKKLKLVKCKKKSNNSVGANQTAKNVKNNPSQSASRYQSDKSFKTKTTNSDQESKKDKNSTTSYKVYDNKIQDSTKCNRSVPPINMSTKKHVPKSPPIDYQKKNSKIRKRRTIPEYPKTINTKASKKEQKKELLNLLKKELSGNNYRQPDNFFQALKVMARNNKIRSVEATQLNKPKKKDSNDEFKCRFKRRRLLPKINKKSSAPPSNTRKYIR